MVEVPSPVLKDAKAVHGELAISGISLILIQATLGEGILPADLPASRSIEAVEHYCEPDSGRNGYSNIHAQWVCHIHKAVQPECVDLPLIFNAIWPVPGEIAVRMNSLVNPR